MRPDLIVCALLLAGVAMPALAKSDLEQTRNAIEQTRDAQAQLAKEQEKLERELHDLQQKLVQAASMVQKAAADLSVSEEKLAILNEQLDIKNKALAASKKNLDALVQAALNLSQMPPESMVMLDGNEDAMKTARALKMTSDAIREDMESIRVQTEELERLQQKTKAKRDDLAKKRQALDKQKQGLQAKMTERKALQEKLGRRQQEEAEKATRLAKEAQDLQSLISSIKRGVSAPTLGVRPAVRDEPRPFTAAKGRLRLPLAGNIVQRFGAASSRNGASRGIVIASRAKDAPVVAPFDGKVVFSGPFLAYGKLVILRHSDDFHTLLAGLSAIDVAVGDFLLEGEPIGAMGGNASDGRLYVELRKNNQPVDPEPWLRGLNKTR